MTAERTVLDFPNGARFYKCALQINPFSYVLDEKKATSFDNEAITTQRLLMPWTGAQKLCHFSRQSRVVLE